MAEREGTAVFNSKHERARQLVELLRGPLDDAPLSPTTARPTSTAVSARQRQVRQTR